MVRFRSLPLIAIRRMRGNWRLLSSVAIGTLVAAAILSSTIIYADAIRDLGLDFALSRGDVSDLDVKLLQTSQGIDRIDYQQSRERVDGAVASALGPAAGSIVRMGTSETFFPTAPGEAVSDDEGRPRAVLRFRSELQEHVDPFFGALPRQLPHYDGSGAIPVAVGLDTAARNGIEVGQQFDLHSFRSGERDPVRVEVVGILEAVDTADRFWGGSDEILDRRTALWETLVFLVPEATFFGALPEASVGAAADFETLYAVELDVLDSRNGPAVAAALGSLERRLSETDERLLVDTGLDDVLLTYDEKLFFTRLPLFILLLQIGGIVAYYLVMVSTMLVERQASEIALLRSRGATTAQLLVQYAIEGFILAGAAAFVGPPLAAAVISSLGPTPAFDMLSGGGLLEVHVSAWAYGLAGGGALIAFASLMLPAWRITHTTMIEFKHTSARPRPTPAFLRYYLDVVLVAVSATVFWQLAQQDQLFTHTVFGDVQADPLLLLTPAVFLLTVGVLFLRLFPVLLRLFALVVGRTRSVAVLVGMRSLVRNPTHYTRLILLLMFATGVGMFAASFGATLDRSYRDRAAYAVGADVRASELRGLLGAGEATFREIMGDAPAEVMSPAIRTTGVIEAQGGSTFVMLLGIEPETFREVGFFRSDFSAQSLDEIADTLEANGTDLTGIPIPPDSEQVGIWVKMPVILGPVRVGLRIRDATGKYASLEMGFIAPSDPATEEWRFLSLPLTVSEDLRLAASASNARLSLTLRTLLNLTPPLSLFNVYLEPQGNIARALGTVHLGAVLATPEPRPEPAEDAEPPAPTGFNARGRSPLLTVLPQMSEQAFPGAVAVHDLTRLDGLEVMQGLVQIRVNDSAVASPDAPPGLDGSIRFQWMDAGRFSPQIRGLRTLTDGEPLLFYMLDEKAAELELAPGDDAVVFTGRKYTPARLAGTFDFFPTVDIEDDNTVVAVVNLSRLLAVVNSTPGAGQAMPSEVWYSTSDPEALRTWLGSDAIRARSVLDVGEELLRQQEDPLVAAGWQGILAIAFGAVLLLSAIGFLVYSYLTAQQRSLEFAILRTLGFSRTQIFGVVAFEHIFVIIAGMGLGTVVGLRVGRMMMDFLGTDERGRQVLPPFILDVSWPTVLLAWGILGSVFIVTIGAVVLMYWRLQVHRALRIGDA